MNKHLRKLRKLIGHHRQSKGLNFRKTAELCGLNPQKWANKIVTFEREGLGPDEMIRKVNTPPPVRRWLLCVDCKSTSSLVAYGEVIVMVPVHFVLHLNILSNDLICYCTTACDKVATSPKMSTPELACQSLIFAQQFAGSFSFEPLDKFGN